MIRFFNSEVPKSSVTKQTFNSITDTVKTQKNLGFINLIKNENLINQSKARAEQIKKNCDKLCIVGIGGSHLGIEVLYQAFKYQSPVELLFFDNVDPYVFQMQLNTLKKLDKVHWVFISKSGNTAETLTALNFIDQYYQSQGVSLPKASTVITEIRTNPLYNWAQKNSVPVLEIPLDVGGRFSVLTPVGVFPAFVMGLNVEKIFKGANDSLNNTNFLFDLFTLFNESHVAGKWVTMLWSYSDRLRYFGFWWQQLWAESLAKSWTTNKQKPGRVSTPVVCRGANDQHSLLQQVMEGEKDKMLIFLRCKSDLTYGEKLKKSVVDEFQLMNGKTMGQLLFAECESTMNASKEVGIPCYGLEVDEINETSIGFMFMAFELLIAVFGEYLNINAFDQPGVERSKVLTREYLSHEK